MDGAFLSREETRDFVECISGFNSILRSQNPELQARLHSGIFMSSQYLFQFQGTETKICIKRELLNLEVSNTNRTEPIYYETESQSALFKFITRQTTRFYQNRSYRHLPRFHRNRRLSSSINSRETSLRFRLLILVSLR